MYNSRYQYGSVPVHHRANVRQNSAFKREPVNRSEEPSRKGTYFVHIPADQSKPSSSYVNRQVDKFSQQDEPPVSKPHVQKATGRDYRNQDATSSSAYSQQETGSDVGSGHTQSSNYTTLNTPNRNYRQEVAGNDSSKETSPASNYQSNLRQTRSLWVGTASRQRLSEADDSFTKEHNTSSASSTNARDKPNEEYTNHDDHMVRPQKEIDRFDKTVTEEMNASLPKTQKLLTTLKELEDLRDESSKEIDIMQQQLKQNISDNAKRKVEDLVREIQTLHEKIKTIENDLNITSAAKETAIYQLKNTVKEKEQVETVLREQHKVADEIAKQNEILTADLKRKEKELKTMHEECKKKETELSDCKSRLSKLMGDRLGDNNPDIADLSDKNRPTKLAEKFQQLYDDEWTDAFEDSEKIFGNERKAIEVLKSTLESIKAHCDTLSNEQTKALSESVTMKPTSRIELSKDVLKQIKDLKKVNAELSLEGVFEQYMQSIQKIRAAGDDVTRLVQNDNVKPFIKKCVQLCWLMCVQDPPLEFGPDPDPYKPIDINVYKFYTKTGSFVDYAVWPPLLLHKGGALLCKGVVQGSNKWSTPDRSFAQSDLTRGSRSLGRDESARDRRRRNYQQNVETAPSSVPDNPESAHKAPSAADQTHTRGNSHEDGSAGTSTAESTEAQHQTRENKTMYAGEYPTQEEWDKFVSLVNTYGVEHRVVRIMLGTRYQVCRYYMQFVYGY